MSTDNETPRLLPIANARLEARADNAEKAFVAAIKTMSEEARERGGAEGRLDASEMADVVDGWKARAEAAEAENLEQARLLGMGAERELALLSRVERADAKLALARQALEIIAGKSQCIDNLMGNGDVAEAALAAMEAADE